MTNQAVSLFEKIKAAVPQVVSSSGDTAETFRISQWAEGTQPTPQQLSQVAAIIAAHNWNEPTNHEKILVKLRAGISALETADANWTAGAWNAEQKAAVRIAIRMVAKMARLTLNDLTSD